MTETRIIDKITSKKILLFFVLFCAFSLGNVMKTEKVYADCGVNTGDIHDYAGALVDIRWKKYDTGQVVQVNGGFVGARIEVNPWDTGPTNDNVVRSESQRRRVVQFSLRDTSSDWNSDFGRNGCNWGNGSDNTLVVLGTGQSSLGTSIDSPISGYNWQLDCDMSVHWYSQSFLVYGVGLPTGARPGGTWTTSVIYPPNGDTQIAVTTYIEPAPSPPEIYNWNYQLELDPTSPSLGSNPKPGAHLQTNSTVTNTGNATGANFRHKICSTEGRGYMTSGSGVSCAGQNPFSSGRGYNQSPFQLAAGNNVTHYASYWVGNNVPHAQQLCVNASIQPYKGYREGSPTGPLTITSTTYRQAGEICWQAYNKRWGLNANVTISPSSAYPGDNVTVTYKSCNTYGLDSASATRGTAPNVSTIITGINGGTNTLTSVNVGANNCQTEVRTQTIPLTATPGSSVCASMNTRGSGTSGRRRGYSDGTWFDNVAPATDNACITVLRRPIPSCGNITTAPADPEPGDTFTMTLKVNLDVSASSSTPFDATLNAVPEITNTPQTKSSVINANSTSGDVTFINLLSNNPISRTVSIKVTILGTTLNCNGPVNISNKPYVSFFGNDVFAGISNGCTGWNYVDGKIRTFTRADYAGSSVQFAAMALGAIDDNGFSSASLRGPPTVEPNRPNGLTMANTTSPLGNLGVSHCVPNYWSKNPGSADTTASLSLTGMASQRKLYDLAGGSLTISGEVGTSQHLEIYVDGDVVIDNNITYAGSGGWASISEIPSLYLIVKGKIYITGGVTQLDGTYIAQPKDGITDSGTIYTCSNGSATYGVTDLYTNCGSQLVINGSFIAQKVKLLRTFGSLRYASLGEYPNTGVRSCGPSLKAVCAAELFNFSPETYLTPGLPSTETPYESITSLPPIL